MKQIAWGIFCRRCDRLAQPSQWYYAFPKEQRPARCECREPQPETFREFLVQKSARDKERVP